MKKIALIILCLLSYSHSFTMDVATDRVTYSNPIINSDYSDPDVVGIDGDYYMTASSFCNVPGLPILHSRNLVDWTIIGHALPVIEPHDFYSEPRHGKGVWAPSIRYHDGMFYIFYGDPDFGIYMVKADNPAGEWSSPVLVKSGKGIIDTTPLWDDDGRAYLVNAWAASRSGMNSIITVTEMKPDGSALIGDPVMVFDGNDGVNHTVEGPKFYKRDGFYYILAPAGGVENGWQLALRSKNPFGPYEHRIVMSQGKSPVNGPHQGGLVDTSDGKSWFLHFQDKGFLGRVVHLNPVTWIDGWPVIGDDSDGDGCGEPYMTYIMPSGTPGKQRLQISDDFSSPRLGKQWSWYANYQPYFGFPSSEGYFRLYGHFLSPEFVNLWEVPNLLTQKFPNDTFTATAEVKVSAKSDGQQSGLIIMGRDYARLTLVKNGDGFDLKLVECKDAEDGSPERTQFVVSIPAHRYEAGAHPNYDCKIWLRVRVDNGNCSFLYSADGKRFNDINATFKARQGKWIGARIGFFSIQPHTTPNRGWMDIYDFSVDL